MMIDKSKVEELVKLLDARRISDLSEYEFVLWLSWLDQRTGFREYRIVDVEEDFKVLCVHGLKVVINGQEFLNSVAAIEIADKYFVSMDSTMADDWKTFIDRIVEEERPRIIPGYSFRRKFGLPESSAQYEVYVLSVDKKEEKQ